MMLTDSSSTSLALVGIPTSNEQILQGIVVIFGTADERSSFFRVVRDYFVETRTTSSRLNIDVNSRTRTFNLVASTASDIATVHVIDVERSLIENIVNLTQKQKYYFVAGAYLSPDGDFTLEPVAERYFYKSEIVIDGTLVKCPPNGVWTDLVDPLAEVIG